jgi:hypothetical protein
MDNQQQNSEEDMAVFVESLLKDMQDRFQTMSSTIIGRSKYSYTMRFVMPTDSSNFTVNA